LFNHKDGRKSELFNTLHGALCERPTAGSIAALKSALAMFVASLARPDIEGLTSKQNVRILSNTSIDPPRSGHPGSMLVQDQAENERKLHIGHIA
jgi:hypothetical protein